MAKIAAECGRHDKGIKMQGVTVVDHPLVQHKLTLMRDKSRSTKGFRQLLHEIGMLLCYEVTRDLPVELTEIETPLATMKSPVLAGKKLVFAPILRAGLGFVDGMLDLVPSARVAHVGLYRDPKTLVAVEYCFKAPEDVAERCVIVMDPVLAITCWDPGGSLRCSHAKLLLLRRRGPGRCRTCSALYGQAWPRLGLAPGLHDRPCGHASAGAIERPTLNGDQPRQPRPLCGR